MPISTTQILFRLDEQKMLQLVAKFSYFRKNVRKRFQRNSAIVNPAMSKMSTNNGRRIANT